jgi:ADP-ribosyl-[dinitrogen reductase] hydrolase
MMSEQDRIAGTLLGMASGDALGAGYEFENSPRGEISMIGGGLGDFAPGEWTDDTSMAVCIAEVTSTGRVDLEAIGDRFLAWARSGPPDIGVSTRRVLGRASRGRDLPEVAADFFAANPRKAAGNGALMRTAPVALAHLGDDDAIASAARAVAELTHADPLAGDSCVLWCIAIDRAIRQRRLDGVHDGLELLPESRRGYWADALADAERRPPRTFSSNGFTVTALQAAHAAITQTPVPDQHPAHHLQHALVEAVRIGNDTDTVAAIAGMVLGARWGASAIPFAWRRMLHGWPGLGASDLIRLAILSARRGRPMSNGWPPVGIVEGYGDPHFLVPLPGDDGVLLGNLTSLADAVEQVDAVVSLCRVGTAQVPAGLEHHEVWLVDEADEGSNPNLAFVIHDAVEAIQTLRTEGKRVFLHCVAGASRTPTVAAAYLAQHEGIPATDALKRIAEVIPVYNDHNTAFAELLRTWCAPMTDGERGDR